MDKDVLVSVWNGLRLEMIPHVESGSHILSSISIQKIDDILGSHLVILQKMKHTGSNQAIDVFERQLILVQEVVEIFSNAQRKWLYLYGVFATFKANNEHTAPSKWRLRSKEFDTGIAVESSAFTAGDLLFREIVMSCLETSEVIKFAQIPDLIIRLQKALHAFDAVTKSLTDCAERLRISFPRFYFVSNDELLAMISVLDLRKLQLEVLFQGIKTLDFDDNLSVRGMTSHQMEYVKWPQTLDLSGDDATLESWLSSVETSSRHAVREHILWARRTYPESKRKDWVLNWPCMAVISVTQIYWTSEALQAISESGKQGVGEFHRKCIEQLEEIIVLTRRNLSQLHRNVLKAFIVVDVHARDKANKLVEENVSSAIDFAWLAQLRHTWESDNLFCSMLFSRRRYCYEYFGVETRIVATPLTDRCHRNLMCGLQLHLGGSLHGPAGTGKTETLKGLAQEMAQQCVVINCSDDVDFKTTCSLFLGAASCGAWLIFDEFNRIDIEVLAVVAQQMLSIQLALQSQSSEVLLGGHSARLDPAYSTFISQNTVVPLHH